MALCVVLTIALVHAVSAKEVSVFLHLNGSNAVATVDEHFVCATLDWWPREKCSYGNCSWNQSSLLNMDLSATLLQKSVEALSPLLIRIGGSLQDQVVYDVGDSPVSCTTTPFSHLQKTRFHFSSGCLNMSRWQELNQFFHKTGALVAFGLNALYGRSEKQYSRRWNSSNARSLINYTARKGYPILAWELGNELSGHGVGGVMLSPEQYTEDLKELRNVIDKAYVGMKKPMVVAPDGMFNLSWFKQLLQHSKSMDALSFHVYNLGRGNGTHFAEKILNGSYNTKVYKDVQDLIQMSGSKLKAWVGEAGGIINGGQHLVSDAFVYNFWYLEQLGIAALHNISVFCRQSLVGGFYSLLGPGFKPNPDYYAALLWKNLMGQVVLNVTSGISDLHTYAHCLKNSSEGGLAILLMNFSNKIYAVNFLESNSKNKLEYHLSAPSGQVHSQTVLLNGRILEPSLDGSIPKITPKLVDRHKPSVVAPLTVAFVVFPHASIAACKK